MSYSYKGIMEMFVVHESLNFRVLWVFLACSWSRKQFKPFSRVPNGKRSNASMHLGPCKDIG